jgi:hypothetical protein
MWLYNWGEQWTLSSDRRQVLQPGSTVVILGDYAHGRTPPWTSLDWWQRLPLQLTL